MATVATGSDVAALCPMTSERATNALLAGMERETDPLISDSGTSRADVRQSVPLATSARGRQASDNLDVSSQSIMASSLSSKARAAAVPLAHVDSDSDNNGASGSGSAAIESDSEATTLSSLKSTVKTLTDQMAWFIGKLNQPEDEQAEIDQPEETAGSEMEEGEVSDALKVLEHSYADMPSLGPAIDAQLATIVNNILKSRLTDEKWRTKIEQFVKPANCDKLTVTRVNPEIWEKLSANARSRDQKAQRLQLSTVNAMLAITAAADNLARAAKTGDTVAPSIMADTLTKLVDAIALLSHANQDSNQNRRDDLKGELNSAYRGLSKGDVSTSSLLYGDDLTSRIKDINEANRVASKLGPVAAPAVGPVAAPRRADVYAAALGQFAIPAQFAEQQLADPRPAPRPVAAAAGPVTYRIVTASTNKDRV